MEAKKTKMTKITAFFLAAVCLCTAICANTGGMERVQAAAQLNGHSLIAENDSYALYMEEDYLSIIIQDKSTGAYMESAISYDDGKNNATWLGAMQSAVVLTTIYGVVDTQQADLVNDDVSKTITYTDNGFSAKLYWNKYQFGLTLEVELTEDGLIARVPDDSIVEDGEDYYIGTISIYPYLGYSYLDDKEGYMFIPDGNGALIYLDDKEGWFASGFSGMVYGNDDGFTLSTTASLLWDEYDIVTDANQVLAPVFGIAHTDDEMAFLGIIEEGAERASIIAAPNGASVDYNRIYARFTERVIYTQYTSNNSSSSYKTAESDRSHSDLQVHYLFLSGDAANYCGMAVAYRNYLLENGGLVPAEDTSYRTRIDFLGLEQESFLLGTSDVVMTTTDDIRSIYADLEEAGVTDILSVYKGWQKGGLYNLPISKYKADSAIGGTSDLTKLIEEAKASGIQFYLYNNALLLNPDTKNATFNVVKQVNKRTYSEDTYMKVYDTFYRIMPARTAKLLSSFLKSYTKEGADSVALAGITDTLYSYYYQGKTYTRYDTAQAYESLTAQAAQSASLALEQPFAYLWQYMDAFLDMPLYTSSYMYEDESVPFMSIVLKGIVPVYADYVNFEANKQEFFLKMVETGSYPSFYITQESSASLINTNSRNIYSSQYDVYRSTIIEYAQELQAVNEKVEGALIVGHELMDNGVTLVTYDNGVKIYLNYGSSAAKADGYAIEAMSYKVVD